jgi:hypothetical protein
MNLDTIRALLGVLGGLAAGTAIVALLYLGPTVFGVALAVSMACVLGIDLVRALQAERARKWEYREEVWARRLGR